MTEEWKTIPEYPNYAASTLGRVRRDKRGQGTSAGRILRPGVSPGGYLAILLYNDDGPRRKLVHRVVAETFLPNPDNLPLVRHLNDVRTDARLENLAWGTHRENSDDAIKNGKLQTRHASGECWRGHDLNKAENYRIDSLGYKVCKPCHRISKESRIAEGLAADDPRHGTRNAYKEWGCKCEPCTKASSDYNRRSYLSEKERGLR